MNINTKEYWENRFSSLDWENKGGRSQTYYFAKSQINYLNISENFAGTILDFGCALGDAIPVYKSKFKLAKFIGVDFSSEAIKNCESKYKNLATFITGSFNDVPIVDVIIASNVFEHLSNDKEVAIQLKNKCRDLFIIVPYKEQIDNQSEHINKYDEFYFDNLGVIEYKIFKCKGWGYSGLDLIINIYFKNIFRYALGKKLMKNNKQILFHIKGIIQ